MAVQLLVYYSGINYLEMPSLVQQDGDTISIGTYRKLHSKILNENCILLVNLPEGYHETTNSYLVLYILYGGQVEGYFAEAVHIVCRLNEASRIPDMIIVVVKNTDRYRDCLPINRNGEPGGADNFLFMTNNTNDDNEATLEYLRKFTTIKRRQ